MKVAYLKAFESELVKDGWSRNSITTIVVIILPLSISLCLSISLSCLVSMSVYEGPLTPIGPEVCPLGTMLLKETLMLSFVNDRPGSPVLSRPFSVSTGTFLTLICFLFRYQSTLKMQCHIGMQMKTTAIGPRAKMISLTYKIRETGLLSISPFSLLKKQSIVRNCVAIEDTGLIDSKRFKSLEGHDRLNEAVIVIN